MEKWKNANYTPSAADTEKIKKYFGLKNLDVLTEKVLQKCIEGLNPTNEELLKQKDDIIREMEKRIQDLERLIELQEEKSQLVKGTNRVGKEFQV